MTRKAAEQTDKAFNTFAEFQRSGMGDMFGMSAAWMEATGKIGAELVSFVADRIQEDVRAQHQMLHCKDIAEFHELQTEFFRKAIAQYQAETGKLIEMGTAALAPAKDQE